MASADRVLKLNARPVAGHLIVKTKLYHNLAIANK
jgi:hypothetical protein